MKINSAPRQAYNFLLDLIFPVLCVECGHEGTYLCNKCAFRLSSLTKEQICPECTKPSPLGKTHNSCRSESPLDGFIHALRYRDQTARRLVELFKYHGIKDIGENAGQLMANEIFNQGLEGYFKDFILIPIPLHPKRLTWRGYNQSEIMAKKISDLMGYKTDANLLVKIKHSTAQAKLNKTQRKENLLNAFEVKKILTNQKLLIIDDVATTRSTLNQAAATLKKAQALEVWALTLAYED